MGRGGQNWFNLEEEIVIAGAEHDFAIGETSVKETRIDLS
jgi:hypothetical protein